MKKVVLGLILGMFSFFQVSASHVFGGEITWKAVRDNNAQNFQRDGYGFIFIMTVYRDCSGIGLSLNNPSIMVAGSPINKHGSIVNSISLNPAPGILGTGYEITPICNGTTSVVRCGTSNPLNGSGGAASRGAIAAVQFWSDTVWLTGVPPSSGWLFQSSAGTIPCCRNANNNTSCAGDMILRARMFPYFTEGRNGVKVPVNVQILGDGSPSFAEVPAATAVQNLTNSDTIIYNNNAVDFDLDFTRYSIDYPFSAINTPCSYNSGYSLLNPMPGIIPPYGTGYSAIDTLAGELRFLPQVVGNFLLCIRVESYRGNQKIAEVYRDFQSVTIANSPGLNYNISQIPPTLSPSFSSNYGQNTYNSSYFIGEEISFNVRANDYSPLGDSVYLMFYNNPVFGAFQNGQDTLRSDSGCTRPPCAVVQPPIGKTLTPMFLNGILQGYGLGAIGSSEFYFKWKTGCGNLKNYSLQGIENYSEGLFSFNISAKDNQCPFNGKNTKTFNIKLVQPATGNFLVNIKGQVGNKVVLKFDSLVNLITKENQDSSLQQSILRRSKYFHKISIHREINNSGYQLVGEIINPKFLNDSIQLNWLAQSQYFVDSIGQGSNGQVHYFFKTLTGCDSFETLRYDTISLNFTSILVKNLPDTIKECGPIALLDAGNPGSNFLWNTGDTTQKITASQSGWYKVVISSSTASLTDSVYVDLLSVDLGNDTSICAGGRFSISPKIQGNFASNGTPAIGSSFGGGLVAYILNQNDLGYEAGKIKGLIVAPNDLPNKLTWGSYNSTLMAGLSESIGKGLTNTNLIIQISDSTRNGYPAARACYNYSNQGFDDWYLPSRNELLAIKANLANQNLGNFHTQPDTSVTPYWGQFATGYWSSSLMTNGAGALAPFFQKNNGIVCGCAYFESYWVRPTRNFTYSPYTYLWSTGDTTPTINVTPTRTTTYYCSISNGITTCTDSIVVTVNGTASANLFADTTSGCGNVTLSAGNNAGNVLWNTSATTSSIQVTQSGTYSVSVQAGGCTLTDTTFVDLLSVDLGNDTSICAGQTYLINPFVQGNPNLKNGLMAAYSFDGNAYDFSGNGNHGKPQGVTSTTDRFGNPNGAYFFRGYGNNDHVFVPNHPSLHIDSVYTMSLWYKEIPGNAMNGVGAYSPTNGTAALFAKEGDGIGTPPGFFADLNYNANGGYSLNYLQVDGCCGVRSKFQAQFSHPMQADSTWKHVVIVNTKDYAETYINGVKVKFASMPSTFLAANRNNLYFGTYGNGKQSPFWYPFYGSMDEVFMYNRALDSNEISALYQLQNSQNQFTYLWSNGATTPYIGVTPAQTTTYYCTVSNGITSCVDSVTITVKPNPPVVALPDTLFQCGNPGRLDAGNPGATYLWSNKATTQSILPVNGGWYSVVVNQNGCTATDSSYVDLLTLDLGRDTGICIGSSITLSVQGQNLGNTSPDSIFVPTDASWKVSVLNPEGWEYVGFNDTNSFWPSARIQGTSNISGAQPIWHPDSAGIYDAYFRKVFEVNGQPNPDFQLEISAENEYYAFVNGRFVGYGNSSMGAKQTYPIAQNLVQGYNSIAIFASNWGASTAQLTALVTGTTDKKSYLWTTGDTTSSITVAPTQTTTYYCTVTNGYTFCTDSIVVRVGTPQATSIQATTCSNQPYVFGGRLISQPGIYVDSLHTSLGCDSVVTLSLNVNPISVDSISAKVCGTSTYTFGGAILTQPGIYVDTLRGSLGCDSFVVLDLQFAQPDTQRINAAICNGSSYAFNGQNLTQSGVYQSTLTNSQGCDSVIILTLNVNSNPTTIVNDTICRGQVYSFGGQNYSNSGQYSFISVNQSGCTTTVVLNLVVNEIQKAVISANGPLEFCGNGSVTLVASAGRSFLWSTGARSSSIQVRQSNSVWVEVTDFNGCVSRSDSQLVIQRLTVPVRPDTIIGFMNPCGVRGTSNTLTYSVDRDVNASSYTWLLTDGILAIGRTDSNVISVTYPAGFTTGQIRVTPVNSCGSGSPRAIYPRTGQPTTTPVVTQSVTSVCSIRGTTTTATYTIQPVDGCNSYLWTLPSNTTLVSGQGTTSIQVIFRSTFTGGVISVAGVSPCGNSPVRTITVSLLAKPVISGPITLCPGSQETYTIPAVAGAIRYRFNLPAGLVLVSQNSNSAVIRNNGSFISGSLGAQVQTSLCGWSQPGVLALGTVACRSISSESFNVAIYPNPNRGEFQLQLGTTVLNVQVSLYSSDGRLVKREMLSPVDVQTLNYQNLAEGLYHLEVVATDLNQQVVRHLEKLMIQR